LIAEDDEFLTDCVDEITVVRYEDYGWGVGGRIAELEEIFFEPDNAEEIEEVGWFVED
jgi:hypothetical protein